MPDTDESVETDPDAVEEVWEDWSRTVNMSSWEVERWLLTDRSRTVKRGDLALGGHQPSRRIITLLNTPRRDLTVDDAHHMREVVDHIRQQAGDRPMGNVLESDWRFALMNWGHDPLRGQAIS